MTRRSLMGLAVLAALMFVVQAILASRVTGDNTLIDWGQPVEAALYVVAVMIVLRNKTTDRTGECRATVFILTIAALLRVMLLPIEPVSTDISRYIWDGRVQGAGINPYIYVPANPSLAALRDETIYPRINRKEYAPTIYPPLAEIIFYLVTRISESVTAMKAAIVGFEALAIWALLRLLQARAVSSTRILLYAWNPLPIWAFAGSGHVDAIAIACVCAALVAAELQKPIFAGFATGGATLTKYFPVIIGPAVYKRWDWKLPAATLTAILLLYLPYLGGGRKVLGFLSGYSSEEGYGDGSGIYLWLMLKNFVPGVPNGALAFYPLLAALSLGLTGLWVMMRDRAKGADIEGAFALVIVFTIVTSPHYDWYMAWLVPFLCLVPLWSVIWLTSFAPLYWALHWPSNLFGGSLIFLPFLIILVLEVTARRLRSNKEDHGHSVAAEAR